MNRGSKNHGPSCRLDLSKSCRRIVSVQVLKEVHLLEKLMEIVKIALSNNQLEFYPIMHQLLLLLFICLYHQDFLCSKLFQLHFLCCHHQIMSLLKTQGPVKGSFIFFIELNWVNEKITTRSPIVTLMDKCILLSRATSCTILKMQCCFHHTIL